jgi:hypothetical protein
MCVRPPPSEICSLRRMSPSDAQRSSSSNWHKSATSREQSDAERSAIVSRGRGSASTEAASGTTGVLVIAVLPLRGRHSPHRPLETFEGSASRRRLRRRENGSRMTTCGKKNDGGRFRLRTRSGPHRAVVCRLAPTISGATLLDFLSRHRARPVNDVALDDVVGSTGEVPVADRRHKETVSPSNVSFQSVGEIGVATLMPQPQKQL